MKNQIIQGDALTILRTLPAQSVQTCITSPPYFGLRDYGVDGQIGLEETPEVYVQKLVEVFREVRRVLRDDGSLWLNLGDSYVHKQLIGIPWRVAFALRADGWHLRQDIIWHKPNPIPESVTDRCTKAHEYIFLLSKSPKYYYDHLAIQERAVWDVDGEGTIKRVERQKEGMKSGPTEMKNGIRIVYPGIRIVYPNGKHKDGQQFSKVINGMRNKRSVWTVTTKPYKGAHFATFPHDLIEPCVLAGAPPNSVVLDPFMGSGTTAAVAKSLGRYYIGCEINPSYIKLANERIGSVTFPIL